ncbi:MAG TPA: MFS transporter [Ktedonobacterales bacterium]
MSEATSVSTPQPSPTPPTAARRAARYASYIFWLMFIVNFLNYLDRYVFLGLSDTIKADLQLTDTQIGLLASAFLLIYAIVAMPLGFSADRIARKGVVAAGVAVWSVATAFTGLARGFTSLFATRAFLGIGEGSYYPAGTPMLAAYFPPAKRAQLLARWSTGALIGAAVGFLLGSFFTTGTWRLAFYFTGIPGLIFAVLIWRVREKTRHEDDPPAQSLPGGGQSLLQRLGAYLRIPTVRVIIAMQALGFFGIYGVTTFLVIYLGATYGKASFPHSGLPHGVTTILAGAIVIVGGILGNLFGGWLSDRLSRRHPGARILTGGLGFLLAAPSVLIAVGAPFVLPLLPFYQSASESTKVFTGVGVLAFFGLLTAFFMNVYNGPVSAATLDVVPAGDRGSAGGTVLSLSHLLGDVYAGFVVGALSDTLHPILGSESQGLGAAILILVPVFLIASGVVGIWGSRFYQRDIEAVGGTTQSVLGTTAGAA